MIVVKLTGGIGNQLFQYAIGLSLSKFNNTDLFLEKEAFSRAKLDRQFALDCFTISNEISSFQIEKKEVLNLKEVYFHYDPSIVKKYQQSIRLVGYWQSEKYFESISYELRKSLKWKLPYSRCYESIKRLIKSSDSSVALHVRRGDFISDPSTTPLHYNLPLTYYKDAVYFIENQIKNFTLFVFSDDIEWCKKNMTIRENIIFVSDELKTTPAEELRLMSLCNHQIIANSTFSWWGAWLNAYSEKIVIAPTPWFRNNQLNTIDLIPESWKKIEVESNKVSPPNLESLIN